MPKLVCVKCQVQYKIKKSGNYVVDMFLDPPEPYRIMNGDRWQCPGCGHEVIAGFGEMPLSEHFHDEFQNRLDKVQQNSTTIKCYESPQDAIPFNGEPMPYETEDNVSPAELGL